MAPSERSLLRFLTCGSVDDGKSTLIGRLLYESNAIFDDQMSALQRDSRKHGTTGEEIDFALLVDGLEAEREQGITIDVAYRFFSTEKRSFIVADTPGHEQFTRNMATGASNAELAVLLVDARKGLLVQTRRHAVIVSLLGIRHVVLAINKIDLVGYDEERFSSILADFQAFAATLGFLSLKAIPVSARFGDNVVLPSNHMPWYRGPTLIDHLERISIEGHEADLPFRFPVQWVNRPHLDFRGLSGTIAGGTIRRGDSVIVVSSRQSSRIDRIATADGDREEARAGDAVTLVLSDEIDAPRGEVLARPDALPMIGTHVTARLVCFSNQALEAGRSYLLKTGTRTVPAQIASLTSRLDVDTLQDSPARSLQLNDIGTVTLKAGTALVFDSYSDNRQMGAFILIDRFTNATAAAGLFIGLAEPNERAAETPPLDGMKRAALKGQKPLVVVLTGTDPAKLDAIADLTERQLYALGSHTMLLDRGGDAAGRARLLFEAGLIVLLSGAAEDDWQTRLEGIDWIEAAFTEGKDAFAKKHDLVLRISDGDAGALALRLSAFIRGKVGIEMNSSFDSAGL